MIKNTFLLRTFIVSVVMSVTAVLTANAQNVGDKFKVGGLYYEITNISSTTPELNLVKVVPQNATAPYWEGDIFIEKAVQYQGTWYCVNSIGEFAFKDCQLGTVSIDYTIKHIERSAFENSSLTSIIIFEDIESIGDATFKNCTSLTSITSTIKNIKKVSMGDNVFENVDKENCVVRVPEGTIGDYKTHKGWSEFNHFKKLLPKGLEFKDKKVQCKIISFAPYEVEIKEDYEHIPTGTFKIPETVTYQGDKMTVVAIANGGFVETGGEVTSLTIPNTIRSIGVGGLASMAKIKSIHIPASVLSIGADAFNHCINCSSITVDKDNPNYCASNNVLFNKDKTTILRYAPKKQDSHYDVGKRAVAAGAFAYSDLSYIDMRQATSIGYGACFPCYNLKKVLIGSDVTFIGGYAFVGCPNLRDVNLSAPISAYEARVDELFSYLPEGKKRTLATIDPGYAKKYLSEYFTYITRLYIE
ncbi:MAG: hypothetical protein CSB16_03190, partial [Clostridiales bacterium]